MKIIQSTGSGLALCFMAPFLLFIFLLSRFYIMFNPWAESGKTKYDDLRIFSFTEFIPFFLIILLIGFCIYFSIILVAWVISGFQYGCVTERKKIISFHYVSQLIKFTDYIQKDQKQLSCKVNFTDQQQVIIQIKRDLPKLQSIEIIGQNIIYLRGVME